MTKYGILNRRPSPLDLNGRIIGLPYAQMREMAAHLGVRPLSEWQQLAAGMAARNSQPRRAATAREPEKFYLSGRITGRVLAFNEPIFRGAAYPSVFRPGCFGNDAAIRAADVLLIENHDWSRSEQILARTSDATLTIRQDENSIVFTSSRLADNECSRRCTASIRSGQIRGASIGLKILDSSIGYHRGLLCEIVTRAELGHIAPEENPACKSSWVNFTN